MSSSEGQNQIVPKSQDEIAYERTRDDLLRRQLSNSENFDRGVLTLSSALLAVSLAWLTRFESPRCVAALVASWVFLTLAIGITLASFFVSQAGVNRQLDAAKRYYLDGDDAAFDAARPFSDAVSIMAWAAAICFAFGVLQMVMFAGSNLSNKEARMVPESIGDGPQRIEGGASIPQFAPRGLERRGAQIPQMIPRQPQAVSEGQNASPPQGRPAQDASQPQSPSE